jgi:hypothetical protein
MLECLLNELFYNFSLSYCKFVSHVRFVWSSFSFWVDLCENDTVFWVSCNCDCVNCRFRVNKQSFFHLQTNNNLVRAFVQLLFEKKKLIMMTTFLFETSFLDRICSYLWLAEFQCAKKYSNLVKKHDFQNLLMSELSADRTSAQLIDSEQIARSFVYVILIEYVNQCKSSDHDLSSN